MPSKLQVTGSAWKHNQPHSPSTPTLQSQDKIQVLLSVSTSSSSCGMNIPKSPKLEWTLNISLASSAKSQLTNLIKPTCCQVLLPSPRKQHEPFGTSPLGHPRTLSQLHCRQYQVSSTYTSMPALILHPRAPISIFSHTMVLHSTFLFKRQQTPLHNTCQLISVVCAMPSWSELATLYPGASIIPWENQNDPLKSHHFHSSNFCFFSPSLRRTFSYWMHHENTD